MKEAFNHGKKGRFTKGKLFIDGKVVQYCAKEMRTNFDEFKNILPLVGENERTFLPN